MDDYEARRNDDDDDDGVAVDESSVEGSVRSESSTGTEDSADDVIPSDHDNDDNDDQVQDIMDDEEEDGLSVFDTAEFLSDRLPHYLCVDDTLIAAIRGFSNSEVRQVAYLVTTASCDKPVTIVSIDLKGNAHDLRVAKRVTKILRGLNLRELKEFELEFRNEDAGDAVHPLKSVIVDHYLTFLLLSVTSVDKLTNVSVPYLGSNEGVWARFLDRFKSIDHLGMGVHWQGSGSASRINVGGIIRRLRQMPSLPHLSLYLDVQNAQPCVSSLFQAVAQLPSLQSLGLDIDRQSDRPRDVVAALNGVHGVVALSPSLDCLQIRFLGQWARPRNGALETDCGEVLESALHSTSISVLRFHNVSLRRSSVGPDDTFTNESVKRIVIRNSVIGASGWSLMQRFRGLESVELDHVESASTYHRAWSEMLMTLPRLSSFSDCGYFQRHCRETHLEAVVSHVASAPSLEKLRLCTTAGVRVGSRVLPSLSSLMLHAKGSLQLIHLDLNDARASDANLGYIASGIEVNRGLKKLDLQFFPSSLTAASIAALLSVLQRHRSIEAFNGEFAVAAPWDPNGLHNVLESLLAMNESLTSFGFRVRLPEGNDQSRSSGMILVAVLRGLMRNQTLRALIVDKYLSLEVGTPSVVAALQTNATLERIEYGYGRLPDQVTWLLDLNRYKRRLLLTPSAVPKGCWVGVVERIVKDHRSDVLYHFLRRILPLLRSCRGVRRPATSQNEEVI